MIWQDAEFVSSSISVSAIILAVDYGLPSGRPFVFVQASPAKFAELSA